VTPYTLRTILAALARDPDDPPAAVIADLSMISGAPVELLETQIREIVQNEEQEM
jgi:hypothetical protein